MKTREKYGKIKTLDLDLCVKSRHCVCRVSFHMYEPNGCIIFYGNVILRIAFLASSAMKAKMITLHYIFSSYRSSINTGQCSNSEFSIRPTKQHFFLPHFLISQPSSYDASFFNSISISILICKRNWKVLRSVQLKRIKSDKFHWNHSISQSWVFFSNDASFFFFLSHPLSSCYGRSKSKINSAERSHSLVELNEDAA